MGANYARVPVGWLSGWLGARLSPMQIAVMVELCRWLRPDGTAWCPRRRMAEELGTTEQCVSNAIAELRRRGLVRLVRRGGPGRASVYALAQASGHGDAPAVAGGEERSNSDGNT